MVKTMTMVLLAILLSFATAAAGDPPGPRRHHAPEKLLEQHLGELGLDEAQTERVRAILDAARKRRRETRPELRAAFDHMRELLEAQPPDEAAIMQQVEKIGALKIEEHKAMMRTLLAVRAELTPEQREKLKAMSREKGPPPWHRRRSGNGEDEG